MNAGVTSLTAVMAKTDLGGEAYVAKWGEEEYVNLVSAYSLYVGAASIVMALVGFGNLASTVPAAVKTGFKVCATPAYPWVVPLRKTLHLCVQFIL